jgi:uncharacterized protein
MTFECLDNTIPVMNYLDITQSLPAALAQDPLQFRAFQYTSPTPGPKVIITGAVHGNETCGTRALLTLMHELETGAISLQKGQLTLVPVTNPLAFQKKQRNGDRNLNRNLRPTNTINEFEDRVANWLCPLLEQHDVLLDLHSFHTGGQPFAMVGPLNNQGTLEPFEHAKTEEAMALELGVNRFVDGWLDTYARGVERRMAKVGDTENRKKILSTDPLYGVGTTEYMRSKGGLAITLECGQHDAADSPLVGYRAVCNTLKHFGLVRFSADQLQQLASLTATTTASREMLSLFEVVDKENVADAFAQPWESFDALPAGTLIGTRANGEQVLAPQDVQIVFPNPRAEAGNEWFYLARRSSRLSS